MIIVQIYVDDISFGATNDHICKDFEKYIHSEFKMSMIRESTFFHGLQTNQSSDGIFTNLAKYTKICLKRFGIENEKASPNPYEYLHQARQR